LKKFWKVKKKNIFFIKKKINLSFYKSFNFNLDLSLGEMIQSDSFSLYDSMSATELGDPKMDYKYGL
jgi:hypothetical protein